MALICPAATGAYMPADRPSLEVPTALITAYILSTSRSASSSRFSTKSPSPSPRTVPSASLENGRASPENERTDVLAKHMCMKISFKVSIPPAIIMSLRPEINSRTARLSAARELAQAASTTQLVPPRSNRLAMRPATTLPKSPGKELSCQPT